MAIEIHEKIESRRLVAGDNPSAEMVYAITGTTNETEALLTIHNNAPVLFEVDTLFLPRDREFDGDAGLAKGGAEMPEGWFAQLRLPFPTDLE